MKADVPVPEGMNLPHGSIWPFAFAMTMTLLLMGIIMGGAVLLLGAVALVAVGVGWIREDMHWWENKLGTGATVGRWGTVLFILSEVFIFGSLFATYFTFQDQGVCPQACDLPLGLVTINTIILFASGATMHWAHHAIRHGKNGQFLWGTALTLVLGSIFVAGQVYEYIELINHGLTLQSHPAGSTFYMLTGTHGLHVVAGLIFIAFTFYRGLFGQFTPERHVAVESAALYWHFVDLVWVFVFGILYLGEWIPGL